MEWKIEVGKGLFVEFHDQHVAVVFAHIADGEDTVETVSLTAGQVYDLYQKLGNLLMGIRAYPTPSYEDLLPPILNMAGRPVVTGCGNAPAEECCGGVCNG